MSDFNYDEADPAGAGDAGYAPPEQQEERLEQFNVSGVAHSGSWLGGGVGGLIRVRMYVSH